MSDFIRCNILLLDRNYFPIKIINWRKAIDLVYFRKNAEVIKETNTSAPPYNMSVIRLLYRSIPNKHHFKIRFNKKQLFERDAYQCVYCGSKDKRNLTIDHIVPKSRGGDNSFSNCATACKKCNAYKDDYMLEEAGMRPAFQPARPGSYKMLGSIIDNPEWSEFIQLYL